MNRARNVGSKITEWYDVRFGMDRRSDSLKEGLAFLGLAVVFFLIAYLIGLPHRTCYGHRPSLASGSTRQVHHQLHDGKFYDNRRAGCVSRSQPVFRQHVPAAAHCEVPSLPDVAGSFDPLRCRLEVIHRDGGSIAVPSESASVI